MTPSSQTTSPRPQLKQVRCNVNLLHDRIVFVSCMSVAYCGSCGWNAKYSIFAQSMASARHHSKVFKYFPIFISCCCPTSPPSNLIISIVWHTTVTHWFAAPQPTQPTKQYAERERVNLNAGDGVCNEASIKELYKQKHVEKTMTEYGKPSDMQHNVCCLMIKKYIYTYIYICIYSISKEVCCLFSFQWPCHMRLQMAQSSSHLQHCLNFNRFAPTGS